MNGPFEGKGSDLHKALEDAWSNAKGQGANPGRYVVDKIEVECTNPISTYHVKIVPTGP